MTCQCCGIADRVVTCELVNGSTLRLCPPCRRRHDELIAAVAIDCAEEMRREEAAILGWSPEEMRALAEADAILGHGGLR